MHQFTRLLYAAMLLYCPALALPGKGLKQCRHKQAALPRHQYLKLSYSEADHHLYHSPEPWQTYHTQSSGTVVLNDDCYLKTDSMTSRGKTYVEKRQLTSTELLALEPGDTSYLPVTKKDFADELFETAHYNPYLLISWLHTHNAQPGMENDTSVYTATVNNSIVTVYVNNNTNLADKITLLTANDLYGDVLTTFHYSQYKAVSDVYVPHTVIIEKTNGKAIDTISISKAELLSEASQLLLKPASFTWKEEPEKDKTCALKKLSPHINLVNIPNADAQTLIVEFAGFMAIVDAPLSSENGEMILREAEKIAPGKPIKYFAFGHHHPWYMGGVRPMVARGITILSVPEDKDYLQYLAAAPHTLQPDGLQLHPSVPVIQEIHDSTTLSDGTYTMKLYVIGKASNHTKDYTIAYFPEEKIVYEDDIAAILNNGKKQKAGKGQTGLYNSIKNLNLDVATIIQSWPVAKYNYKCVMTFNELKETIE